jgi:hypothetical protein
MKISAEELEAILRESSAYDPSEFDKERKEMLRRNNIIVEEPQGGSKDESHNCGQPGH